MTNVSTDVVFNDNTDKAKKEIENHKSESLKTAARVLEQKTKKAATRSFTQQTGNLRRSITPRPVNNLTGDADVWKVMCNPMRQSDAVNVNYAIFLEYGTRYIAPRAFMRKGAADAKDAIRDKFSDSLKAVDINFGSDLF